MASSDLRQELDCSICVTTYTDPVNLRCGHSYCRVCIDRVLDTQEGSGGYSCPECREEFRDRPVLHRNITLRNILETFRSTQPDKKETGIFCTQCIHSPVPAVKSCLMCEASLCNDHLRVHSKSLEHVLTDPTTSMENRKCSIHRELLKYYCTEDSACICVSCSLAEEHWGHKVETLDEASENKKLKLRTVLQKLIANRKEIEQRIRSLQEHKGRVQERAAGERERVTALFIELRRHLEDLENRERHNRLLHDGGDLDVSGISHTLHTGLSDMIKEVNVFFYIQEPSDILLDVNTAGNNLQISDDMKTVSRSDIEQNRPETPERFQNYNNVLSSIRFSSGRHYWEVDVSKSEWWVVGMCYPSIERRGKESVIGYNKKSWCLCKYNNQYFIIHDSKVITISPDLSSNRVRIYVDYEAGQIFFYDLCDPIRHLHTFTTTFTEPLHAGLCVRKGHVTISREGGL
ncbi:E3 ubiquitin-protein ligase TRIM39-like [Rana temporaria]|uniref:E3 ubiquitin-protein ligase TRIM39-like n=1 Tax=Rana temporaria TaxID=8407 RepID=UPI001AACED68|nr:E3 ubiquitin-protein ligase TRIM39-like [Rana temporaria]